MMMINYDFSRTIKGFMADDEARRLYGIALKAASMGPCLEIGSYCGKSAYFIGMACRQKKGVLFSVDHHMGSEEQQPGEEYFDPELLDGITGKIDTFRLFRNTLERAGLTDTVVPVVAPSVVAGKMWSTPLSMVFIDGGHTFDAVFEDYRTWAGHLMKDGFLVIHDIFFSPEEGGQAPRKMYETAIASGRYEPLEMTGTLGTLRRID